MFFHPTSKVSPLRLVMRTDMRTTFLAHYVIPMPSLQLLQHFHRSKFVIANQQNSYSFGKKASNIVQQSQLCLRSTMPSNLLDPCPCDWNRPFMVSQPNHQQLVRKTNFRPIHNLTDLLKMPGLHSQPAASNWLVPLSDIYRRVGHKTAHALDHAEHCSSTGDLACDSAQANRSTLMNANYQPGEVLNTGYSFHRVQLSNSYFPCLIEGVDRHDWLLSLNWRIYGFRSTLFVPINPLSEKCMVASRKIINIFQSGETRPQIGRDQMITMQTIYQFI
jgi:hypothetical protein